MIRRFFILLLVMIFILSQYGQGLAYTMLPDFLCEIGMGFYKAGRLGEALHEFQKALLVNPENKTAKEYIGLIQEKLKEARVTAPEVIVKPEAEQVILPSEKSEAVDTLLDQFEGKPIIEPKTVKVPAVPKKELALKKEIPPAILNLDEKLKALKMPLEIEQEQKIIIRSKNISRFLVTQPDILSAEKVNSDEIAITGKNLGYTYLHIWDDTGRNTLEFMTMPPRPIGLSLEEKMRKEEERTRNFKLRYSVDWSSSETGRRLDSLERSSYSWDHALELTGETPYGNLDSSAELSSLKETTDLTYYTLGLTQGKYGPFQDFTLRGFDFTPAVSNLAFSAGNLRGAMLNSPVFNRKIDYTVFWGREGGGKYGGLSPGLAKVRDSFLTGVDVNFKPQKEQNYNISAAHGWGSDRPADSNPYGYDIDVDYNFKNWGLGYEVGYDTETFAYLIDADFKRPKFSITNEFRNTPNDFRTMTGLGYRAGELGLLTTLNYVPSKNVNMTTRLDIFKDRLFPNPQEDDRWNQDFDWNASLQIDPVTSLSLDYSLQNEQGSISPYRSHNFGIGWYRTFEWLHRLSTFLNYRRNKNVNYRSHASDYESDKILSGFRLPLFGNLSYFLNGEISWVEATAVDDSANPHAYETGLDWSNQIFNSPFYANLNFRYRDEENTESPFSFLSGEDYIEGYGEISYRPKPEMEAFFNTRVRNAWAEQADTSKHVDVNFYSGMRYLWDTGLRWESVGMIEGYVFKDLNSDGLRQRDEPPLQGIKIWLGKDKSTVTDLFGYYKFKGVRARKVYLNIDTTTIPSGYVLTVPATQEAAISHGKRTQIHFGLASRTEIIGMVFLDADADGQLGPKDMGISGVVITQEDGTKATTDDYGRYSFKKLSAGKYKITLDLKTLPAVYIPTVPIFNEVELVEGQTHTYNFPLRKAN